MRKIIEMTVAAAAQDEKFVQASLDQIMSVFKDYLEITRRTNHVSTREFYFLYYDLHYFLKHDIQKVRKYSAKDILSFSTSFLLIYEKLEKVIYLSESYVTFVFEKLYMDYYHWFEEITEAKLNESR